MLNTSPRGRQSLTLSCNQISYHLYTFSFPIPVIIVLHLGSTGKYEFFCVAWLSIYCNLTRCVSHEFYDSGYTVICLIIWHMKYRALYIYSVICLGKCHMKSEALNML